MSHINNTVQGFLFEDLDIRGAYVHLGSAWRSMTEGRGYAPAVARLLGQTTAVATLIAANLKQPGRLSFHVRGHGPLSLLVVDCNERLRLRGMAKAEADLKEAPLPALVGDGRLVLSLHTEAAREPYQSVVPLAGDTVAAIFEHYLAQSEQQPTGLWLACDDQGTAGLFLQALPGAAEKDADGWNRLLHLAATVKPEELLGLSAAELLPRLFPEETVRLFEPRVVAYECPRDEDKVAAMLRSLGREEVETMIGEEGVLEVKDDICNQTYRFDAGMLARLFDAPKPTLH
ncbi:MAG: Hsp33 family molecular chaperone HslO [Rhodocyclaceae bacterium]|nr:Hsp33 family molecular chaperone HslO [Rhodocyclaceae bacterium]